MSPLKQECPSIVMKTQSNISKASGAAGAEAPDAFHKEVKDFSSHCAYIRTVYVLATRIWRDCNEQERKAMEPIAPALFLNLGQVLAEYVILSACCPLVSR